MELVDSKQKILTDAEVMAIANSELPIEGAAFSYGVSGIKGTKLIQVNNTIFAERRGKDKSVDQFLSVLQNADVLNNVPSNIIQYLQHLQKNKIMFGAIFFRGGDYWDIFIDVYKKVKADDVKVTIAEHPEHEKYLAYITIGDKPIGGEQ